MRFRSKFVRLARYQGPDPTRLVLELRPWFGAYLRVTLLVCRCLAFAMRVTPGRLGTWCGLLGVGIGRCFLKFVRDGSGGKCRPDADGMGEPVLKLPQRRKA